MKPWIVLSLLLVPFLVSAADFWDGNAALQRGDATFESGLYATSNSFPAGTQITILNEDTGKTVTATVTGRIEGQSDILVLLSPKTAQALGLSQGTLGRVRVTLPPRSDTAASRQTGDQTVSRDPDVNPAAGTRSEQATEVAQAPATEQPATEQTATEQPTTEQPTTEQPTTEQQTAEQTATEQTAAEQPTTEQPTTEQPTTEQQTAEQPAAQDADAAAILSDAEARSPQKQVFQPPREDQKFVYHPPAATQPAATTQAAAGEPTITSVYGEPGVIPPAPASQSMALADVAAPQESRPQEIEGEGTAAPAPAPETPQAALAAPEVAPEEPAAVAAEPVQTEVTAPAAVPPAAGPEPRVALAPPETPAPAGTSPASTSTASAASAASTAAAASAASAAQAAQPAVSVAAARPAVKGAFYLQLAAFGTEQTARDLAAKLAPTYPALVLAPAGAGSSVYKVVIGPLNRAESGTLLLWFRYRGYPDAFLKQE